MDASKSDLVATGISGLNAILSGGIPRGNVILLEGAIGTGKTTMGTEFVYRGAKEFGEPGVIVVFEVSPDKLARDMAGLGWDLPALERESGHIKKPFDEVTVGAAVAAALRHRHKRRLLRSL